MAKQEQILETITCDDLPTGNNGVEVKVYYTLGGPNYFSGGCTQRGYYLSVTPCLRKNGMVRVTVFSGIAAFLMPANRFSQSSFETAVKLGRQMAPELIQKVLEKEWAKKTA
jgi:hypothetical protein